MTFMKKNKITAYILIALTTSSIICIAGCIEEEELEQKTITGKLLQVDIYGSSACPVVVASFENGKTLDMLEEKSYGKLVPMIGKNITVVYKYDELKGRIIILGIGEI